MLRTRLITLRMAEQYRSIDIGVPGPVPFTYITKRLSHWLGQRRDKEVFCPM